MVVVDGGSTDETDAILASFGPRVRVIKERGGGPGGARNLGVDAASGKYAVFVDSDDVLRPGALTIYARILSEVSQATMVLAGFREFSTDDQLTNFGVPESASLSYQRFDDYLQAALQGHLSGTHRLVIDRSVFMEAGGLTTKITVCEDQDFGLRVNGTGPCVVVLDPPTVGYRSHPGNISGSVVDFGVGVRWLIRSERSGIYPGGESRRASRRAIISRTARSTSMVCLDKGRFQDGFQIYGMTLLWHVRQWRIKYLCGFPLAAALAPLFFRRSRRGRADR